MKTNQDIIKLKIWNGHQIWIREGFRKEGWKYYGLFTKPIHDKTTKEEKPKWKNKKA